MRCAVVCCPACTELAKQLIKAGAPVNDAEGTMGLQPLHLACLGKVVTKKQVSFIHQLQLQGFEGAARCRQLLALCVGFEQSAGTDCQTRL